MQKKSNSKLGFSEGELVQLNFKRELQKKEKEIETTRTIKLSKSKLE